MKKNHSHNKLLVTIILLLVLMGCKKDDPVEKIQENEDFYEFMDYWYYWYSEIPKINPSLYPSPNEVLEAIRYRPLDRWSSVGNWDDVMAYYQDSKFIGYGFGSSWDPTGKLRIGFISNTVDLYMKGVRRGWIIDAINGNPVRQGVSIGQLLGENVEGVTNTFRFIKPDNSTVEITSAKTEVKINTVLHREVIPAGDKRVAYMVLQGFTEPTIGELDEAFAFFSALEADEFVLDLRYNGGGLMAVANYLASMIGGDKLNNKTFVRYEYNNKRSDSNRTVNFNDQVKHRLNLSRMFAICTRSSASASELVINSLKPFMPVYIVGANTYGKPMGSNIFGYPKDNPVYAFMPITFKTTNADGVGDYFDGFPADISAGDDLSKDFGNPEEASLKAALHFIQTGGIAKSLLLPEPFILQPRDEMTGIRWEIGSH